MQNRNCEGNDTGALKIRLPVFHQTYSCILSILFTDYLQHYLLILGLYIGPPQDEGYLSEDDMIKRPEAASMADLVWLEPLEPLAVSRCMASSGQRSSFCSCRPPPTRKPWDPHAACVRGPYTKTWAVEHSHLSWHTQNLFAGDVWAPGEALLPHQHRRSAVVLMPTAC